jgi:ATP-binding cassette subfamily E protein 1
MGKKCIEVNSTYKMAEISEVQCIGCGICVKKCPFNAIEIINLPKNLEKETTHRFGPNQFIVFLYLDQIRYWVYWARMALVNQQC